MAELSTVMPEQAAIVAGGHQPRNAPPPGPPPSGGSSGHRPATAAALTAARALLASVDHDNNGETIGMQRIGGNGGLISLKTTRAADTLRLALDKLDNGS